MTNLTDTDPLSPLMTGARLAFVVYLAKLPPDDETPRRMTDWVFEEEGEFVYATYGDTQLCYHPNAGHWEAWA